MTFSLMLTQVCIKRILFPFFPHKMLKSIFHIFFLQLERCHPFKLSIIPNLKFWMFSCLPRFFVDLESTDLFWFNKVQFYLVIKWLNAHFFRKFQNYFISLEWQDLRVTELQLVLALVRTLNASAGAWELIGIITANTWYEESKRIVILGKETRMDKVLGLLLMD